MSRTPVDECYHYPPSIALPVKDNAHARELVALALHISLVFTHQHFCPESLDPGSPPSFPCSMHAVSCVRCGAGALCHREADHRP